MDVRDTYTSSLAECKIPSPVINRAEGANHISFVSDDDRILIDLYVQRACKQMEEGSDPPSYELAGPRRHIFFDPSKLKCALVTCGGLCPGLNDIIRSIVLELHYGYGVRNIFGVRYGLRGFIPRYGYYMMQLTPNAVVNIHERGGVVIGSSRGPQDIEPSEYYRPNIIIYAAKVHPELTGGDLILTYATNTFEFDEALADSSVYFPRFVRLSRCK